MSEEIDKTILDLHAAGKGDAAFRLLIDTYKRPLYQHARRMVRDHADADDLLQDSFIKAWRALPEFRNDSKLYSWLYRITTNVCLNFIEKRNRRATLPIDTIAEIRGDSHSSLSSHDIQSFLTQALESLPAKQKQVFVMKYFDTLKYEEMAVITGTSVGALKSSYHIAVKKIEEFLTQRSNL